MTGDGMGANLGDWLGLALDVILIGTVGAGTVQVARLIRQLRDLRASRAEMERFVRDFNAAVIRAEVGVKALRAAARDSGDDLEKLVEKAVLVRDELNFIVDSADGVAERLSATASQVLHGDRKTDRPPEQASPGAVPPVPSAAAPANEPPPMSRAERELMQALQKLK